MEVWSTWGGTACPLDAFTTGGLLEKLAVYVCSLELHSLIPSAAASSAELNVFEGFFDSPLFTAVMVFTLFMQIVIVQYGGEWVGCVALSCMLKFGLQWIWRLSKHRPPYVALE